MKQLKVRKQAKAVFLTGLMAIGLLTANLAMAGESSEESRSTPLAVLSLGDGTKAEFHEPIPGELVVLAQYPAESKDGTNPLSEALQSLNVAEDGEVDPLSLFTLLSQGVKPPDALVEAYDRLQQARKSFDSLSKDMVPSDAERKDVPTVSDDSSATFWLSATVGSGTWFREHYCPLTTDYCYCMLYRTGSGSITRWTDHMRSTTYPYRGTVTHALQYYAYFGYITSISQNVPQGYVGWISISGIPYYRRAAMSNASGDGFHWSVYGGTILGCLPYPCYCSAY